MAGTGGAELGTPRERVSTTAQLGLVLDRATGRSAARTVASPPWGQPFRKRSRKAAYTAASFWKAINRCSSAWGTAYT